MIELIAIERLASGGFGIALRIDGVERRFVVEVVDAPLDDLPLSVVKLPAELDALLADLPVPNRAGSRLADAVIAVRQGRDPELPITLLPAHSSPRSPDD